MGVGTVGKTAGRFQGTAWGLGAEAAPSCYSENFQENPWAQELCTLTGDNRLREEPRSGQMPRQHVDTHVGV